MMSEVEQGASTALRRTLDNLGVRRGDTVYLGTDMSGIPLPPYEAALNREAIRAREQQWCAFVYAVVRDVIGGQGTLIVPAFSYSCGRPGSRFVKEESPSEVSPFTEWFRKNGATHRSLHPLFSISGVGRFAEEITRFSSRSAFGWNSAFDALNHYGTKFVSLGTRIANSLTYLHHVEQCFGCNHRYTKVFDADVVADGQTVKGPWLAYVAYRGATTESDFRFFERAAEERGLLISSPWNGYDNHCIHIEDTNRLALELLQADPCALANRPVEIQLDDTKVLDTPSSDDVVRFLLSLD